jgi:hypothetical protein
MMSCKNVRFKNSYLVTVVMFIAVHRLELLPACTWIFARSCMWDCIRRTRVRYLLGEAVLIHTFHTNDVTCT